MIAIITAFYCALVYAAFRVIKIPVRTSTITAAIAGGVFIIGGIVIGWQGAAPVSKQITLTRFIVAINPDVKALIKTIFAEPGQKVKKGDVLFELEKGQFEGPVVQAAGQLNAAKREVDRLQAALELADASIAQAVAKREVAKSKRDASEKLKALGSSAVRELRVFEQERDFEAAQAAVVVAEASKREAKAALASGLAKVDSAQGQLDKAKDQLRHTSYKSPVDGILLNWQARPGTMTTSLGLSAVGTIMETGHSHILVVLPQNLLRNVAGGDPVEIAFKSKPGRIATGKVLRVANFTGEGQLAPKGTVPKATTIGSEGFYTAVVKLDDEAYAEELGLGEAGAAAIYTRPAGPFHVISKIYLRVISLSYYLPM